MKPVSYLQTDPRWANNDYSAPGESTTIGKAGCGPTCMAMVIATLKDVVGGTPTTPGMIAAWSLAKKFKALKQGTYYTFFEACGKAFGVEVDQVNHADLRKMAFADAKKHHLLALEAIQNGDYVIACMGPGLWTKAGHFILWYGIDGSGESTNKSVLINDPASIAPHRTKAPYVNMQQEVKYYWIIKNTKKQEEVVVNEGFKDIKSNRWSANHIRVAKEMGIMLGDDSGNFNPTAPVTREELAVVAVRIVEKLSGKKVL